jgi:hypothetical protein
VGYPRAIFLVPALSSLFGEKKKLELIVYFSLFYIGKESFTMGHFDNFDNKYEKKLKINKIYRCVLLIY